MHTHVGLKVEQVSNTWRELQTQVSLPPKPCFVPQFCFSNQPWCAHFFCSHQLHHHLKAISYIDQGAAQLGPQHLEQTLSGLHPGPFSSVLCWFYIFIPSFCMLCFQLLLSTAFSRGDSWDTASICPFAQRARNSRSLNPLKQPIANGWLVGSREAHLPCLQAGQTIKMKFTSQSPLQDQAERSTLPENGPWPASFSSRIHFPDFFSCFSWSTLLKFTLCISSCFWVCFWGTSPKTTPD